MKQTVLVFTFFSPFFLYAQPTVEQRIQDSVVGWWSNNRFDRYIKPTTDPVALRKIANLDHFVEWVKKSYTPVASLGTYIRSIGANRYSVVFSAWNVSAKKEWTEADGKFKPIPEENTSCYMDANAIPGSYPINFINKRGQSWYFVWEPDGYAVGDQTLERRKGADPRIHPNVYPFLPWINEWHTVFLVPGNKLPFTPVTQGELLEMAEAGLDGQLEKNSKEVIDKYREKIRKLRIKHAATLGQQAIVRDMQPNMYSFELDPDIFVVDAGEKALKHYYPVYKLEPALVQKMKSDQPQWIAVYFPFATHEGGTRDYELYKAMSENINYGYIYNYFFDPEKIKGVSYMPANGEQLKARLDAYRNKYKNETAVTARMGASLPAGVLLYDDFHYNASGSKPAGWYMSSYGKPSTVTTINGVPGSYLKMGYNNKLSSTTVHSLPNNFSIEYDILTDPFTGRTGGSIVLTLNGSTKRADGVVASADLSIEVTAGLAAAYRANSNYRGLLSVRLDTRPSNMDYNNKGGRAEIGQSSFTDEKKKVHVTLRKEGGNIVVLLDGKKAVSADQLKSAYGKPCGDCVIPSDVLFTSFEFQNLTQDADVVNVYMGNVTIRKL